MSIIETLITDRTESDVAEWARLRNKGLLGMTPAELETWMAGMKGSYNPAIDMNRVGMAMEYVWTHMKSFGYVIATISPKTDWEIGDIPTEDQLNHYLEDLKIMRSAISVTRDTPAAPETMDFFSWAEANNIERILVTLETLLNEISKAFRHSGVTISGMNGGLRL